jgi:hypothetical protein
LTKYIVFAIIKSKSERTEYKNERNIAQRIAFATGSFGPCQPSEKGGFAVVVI